MTRILIVMAVLPFLTTCATETRVVRDNSVAAQFAQMNKNGWQVSGDSVPRPVAHKSGSLIDDPSVKVIHGVDWNAYRFDTNFQRDDQPRKNQQNQPATAPATQPATFATPFGILPTTPGR